VSLSNSTSGSAMSRRESRRFSPSLLSLDSFTAVSRYVFFPQKGYTQPRGFHQTTQTVYLIAGLGVFPEPFSSAIQFALLVLLVSTVALDFSQALTRTIITGCLPNVHHHPRQRAEESYRLLLDPCERFAVCEQRAIAWLAQPSGRAAPR
jgi:hypothetical protein